MIKKRLVLILFLGLCAFAKAQVGIGTTDPKASLDISAINPLAPSATEGILIPRIDEFPTGVTSDQDGMMVFLTGNGTPAKGFYYWDNTATIWLLISGVTGGGVTLDQAYDFGGAGAGNTIIATDGAVTINGEDGMLVTGTFGAGETINVSGEGARMFFNPRKSAFRTGYVFSSQWNDANVGEYSTAFGHNPIASGENSAAFGRSSEASGTSSTAFGSFTEATATGSTAFGSQTEASGLTATAFGNSTIASGSSSTAFSSNTVASGFVATAFGRFTIASGSISTAIGLSNTAPSAYETTIGVLASEYTPISTTLFEDNDRLFTIGNGTNVALRSNALTIYKSGLMNINDEYNMPLLDGTVNQVMTTDGAGNVTFQDAGAGSGTLDNAYDFGGAGAGNTITATDGAVTINGEDGFLVTGTFGAGETINVSGEGARMFFNPRKSAFRAGRAFGTEWDNANVGNYSVAFSRGARASGDYSFSMGFDSGAIGNSSFAFGDSSAALGDFSVSLGAVNTASGNSSIAIGFDNEASGNNASAFGLENFSQSFGETTMGIFSTVNTPLSTTTFNLNDRLFSIGNGSDAGVRSNAITIYKNGLLNINDEYNMPLIDGTINQVMTTDGAGNVTFQTPTTLTDTDNQQIDVLNLDGTDLEISLQDDGVITQTLDLSPLRILVINDLTDGKTDTGNSSVFLGAGAGNNDNDGLNFNTGIGASALTSNTSGFQNTALGNGALLLNTTGSNNVALGQVALIDNTTGSENIAIGRNAVANNVDGDQNIGIGGQALFNNISTNDNIAIGNQSLFSSTTGRNIGIGTSVGTNITTGTRNIGIGFRAQSSNTQGNDNVTIGEAVMNSINSTTNASNNVALGNDAMSNLSEGSNNVAIGTSALFGNGNGNPNFANNNVAIGYQAGLNTEGDNNIFIGYQAGLLNPFSNNKLFIENSNGDENDALIYGEFDTNILRTNGELQIGNPTTTGYAFPTTDGTNGQILITDGTGNVTFQNAGANGGTLDQAYDFGGAGIGRTINVDNGAVVIQGDASGVTATTSAQLILTETDANDFSRLRFTNSVETDNTWTIASRTDNTDANSIMNINHTNAGDIIQVFGDGVVEMNGQIGINLNNPDRALTLPNNTDILIGRALANSWDIYSDSRVKTNQQLLKNGLNILLEITPKTYFHHDSNFTNGILQLEEKGLQTVGFIAQELYKVLPEAVQKPENENIELWSVDYDKVVPITVQAIQELKKEIDSLKLENQQLKTQLSKYSLLETRILALENTKISNIIISE